MAERRYILFLLTMSLLVIACWQGPSDTTLAIAPSPVPGTERPSEGLSSSEVYDRVAPSLAFLETSVGSGSGLLLSDGKVLTNAHVVWPFRTARVVFPNGTEVTKALLVGSDDMADLAVLDVSFADGLPDPVSFADGENLDMGSDVYLLGYPAEADAFPTPTITRGILSAKRSWELLDLTYLQTDAAAEGGQSGGALVDERGEVIGLSTFGFGEGFALAASISDVASRVDALLAGQDLTGLGVREFASAGGESEAQREVPHFFAEPTWVMWPSFGETVEVEVQSEGDAWLTVYAPDGYGEIEADETETGSESGSFEVSMDGPHFVTVGSSSLGPIEITLSSNAKLRPFRDPDDGASVRVGEPRAGRVDYPGDADWFELDLEEGQRVFVTVDTVAFDAQVAIDRADNPDEVLFFDDDSGGGIFGDKPAGSFVAPTAGTYLVWVREAYFEDAAAFDSGGYMLSIEG